MAYKGRILARSPYYVTAVANTAPILSAKLLVWVWTGDVSSQPANPTYTIDKLPLKGDDDSITFEISQLVRDFIGGRIWENGGEASSPRSVWVATQISMVDTGGIDLQDQDTYLGHLGYGYYSEEVNPTPSIRDFTTYGLVQGPVYVIQDEVLAGDDPVDASYAVDNYDIYVNGVFNSNKAVTISTESRDGVYHVGEINFGAPITKIVYKQGVAEIKTTNFLYDDCAENTIDDYLHYIDKDGLRKQIFIGGRKIEGTNVTRDSYKRDVSKEAGGIYSYQYREPQKYSINQTSKQTITINTGWVSDEMNEDFRQMMLAEEWSIGKVRPAFLNTNTIQYRENKEDKLINYTFEFEEANNLINDVY